ncbi:cold shock domain-containing protein [Deminuibacter soli]|uniref:Cold shock domain-containing protein n=1 Tax=Deminuibacter soli TaxID=2291815 RepID=A0A3E1NEI3_9BACT|nr:cold shock domain-containing protein [Deminuibacter soli]RFM26393.1 cold shock domain-containing protein [Deminuibacter soli]
MGRSQESFNKSENEKKRQKKKQEKIEKREERKANGGKGKSLEDMMAYIDENGNITDTPPDPNRKIDIKAEDIQIGVPKQDAAAAAADNLRRGVVTFFNEAKGFGFIRDQKTGESIFVHVNALNDRIKENNIVVFEVQRNAKGLNAVDVRLDK